MNELVERLQYSLGDSLVIERELGGGGMSYLFVARERALGRAVVVKVLAAELAGALSVERFRREMQVLASLQHAHIVPILATGEAGDVIYYTMPYVEGESLRQRLDRERALPVGDVIVILRDILGALSYAHRRGIIHRDIKPGNVLLSEGGALVADFGIAKAMSDARTSGPITGTGVIIGTPSYLAPEQAVADPNIDERVDIYATGAMAYEMLAGEELFGGLSPHHQLAAHTIKTPVPLTERRAELPPALEQLVMKCLAKDPAARPHSADAMLQALDGIATAGGRVRPSAMGLPSVRGPAAFIADLFRSLISSSKR